MLQAANTPGVTQGTRAAHPAHGVQVIHGVRVVADHVELDTATGPVVIAGMPSPGQARRFAGLARRCEQVDIVVGPDGSGYGRLTAIWHRLPHTQPIPLGAALSLVIAGVPARLIEAAR